jgi:hypothetical protein
MEDYSINELQEPFDVRGFIASHHEDNLSIEDEAEIAEEVCTSSVVGCEPTQTVEVGHSIDSNVINLTHTDIQTRPTFGFVDDLEFEVGCTESTQMGDDGFDGVGFRPRNLVPFDFAGVPPCPDLEFGDECSSSEDDSADEIGYEAYGIGQPHVEDINWTTFRPIHIDDLFRRAKKQEVLKQEISFVRVSDAPTFNWVKKPSKKIISHMDKNNKPMVGHGRDKTGAEKKVKVARSIKSPLRRHIRSQKKTEKILAPCVTFVPVGSLVTKFGQDTWTGSFEAWVPSGNGGKWTKWARKEPAMYPFGATDVPSAPRPKAAGPGLSETIKRVLREWKFWASSVLDKEVVSRLLIPSVFSEVIPRHLYTAYVLAGIPCATSGAYLFQEGQFTKIENSRHARGFFFSESDWDLHLGRRDYLPVPEIRLQPATPVTDKFDPTYTFQNLLRNEAEFYLGTDVEARAKAKAIMTQGTQCGISINDHLSWRDMQFRVVTWTQNGKQPDVRLSQVRNILFSCLDIVSGAHSLVVPEIQDMVNLIGTAARGRFYKPADHVLVALQSLLKHDTMPPSMSSVISDATIWKACYGCPMEGAIVVTADTKNGHWTIEYTDVTPTSGGQVCWLMDNQLIAHCGDGEDTLFTPPEPFKHKRSHSLGLATDIIRKTVIPSSVKMDESILLSDAVGLSRESFITPEAGEVNKWLLEKLKDNSDSAWDAFLALRLGSGPYKGPKVQVHKNCLPSWQVPLSWVLYDSCNPHKASQALMETIDRSRGTNVKQDLRKVSDIVNHLHEFITATAPVNHVNQMVLVSTAWKAAYGCPSKCTISVILNTEFDTINIYYWDEDNSPRGGLFWSIDGTVISHCSNTLDYTATAVKKGCPLDHKGNPRLPSPFDFKQETRRNNEETVGHVITRIRHEDQSKMVRDISYPGLHSLRPDIVELYSGYKYGFANEAAGYVKGVADTIKEWCAEYEHKYIVMTGMKEKDLSFEYPVINLVSTAGALVVCNEYNSRYLEIRVPMASVALRNLRVLPAHMQLPGVEGVLIANGRSSDLAEIDILRPEEDIPFPKCSLYYFHALACHNLWIKPGCLRKPDPEGNARARTFFINTLCVYGADEIVFLDMPITVVLKRPSTSWRGRPHMAVTAVTDIPCNVTYRRQDGSVFGHMDRMNLVNLTVLYERWTNPTKATINRESTATRPVWPTFADACNELLVRRGKWPDLMVGWHVPVDDNPVIISDVTEMIASTDHWQEPEYRFQVNYIIALVMWWGMICNWLSRWLYPEIPKGARWFTSGEAEYPEGMTAWEARHALNIRAFGTTGDILPMEYVANVSEMVGVRTHITATQRTTSDLENLKKGDFTSWLPAFLHLLFAPETTYGHIFMPHVEIASRKVSCYSLSPPPRYILPSRYTRDTTGLGLVNQIALFFAHMHADVFMPTYHVGVLNGCTIPRGMHAGMAPKRVPNKGLKRVGWTSGSAGIGTIRKTVRELYEEIPRGDHSKIMAEYSRVYCHGGAGTMQTALLAGAEAISCDNTLDRAYLRPLTQNDVHIPSCLLLYGILCYAGLPVDAPFIIKMLGFGAYIMTNWWLLLRRHFMDGLKGFLIFRAIWQHHLVLAMILCMIPAFMARVIEHYGFWHMIHTVLGVLWKYPFLLTFRYDLAVTMYFLFSSPWLLHFAQDIYGAMCPTAELIWEPLSRHHDLPFPFGHWLLRDMSSGAIYEGVFTTKDRSMGAPFKLVKADRDVKPGCRVIPIPADMSLIEMTLAQATAQPYGPAHNCATLCYSLARHRGVCGQLAMLLVTLLISLVIAPPFIIQTIVSWFQPGLKLTDTKYYVFLQFAGYDGQLPDDESPNVVEDVTHIKHPDTTDEDDDQDEQADTDDAEMSLDFLNQHDSWQIFEREFASLIAILIANSETDVEREIIKEAAPHAVAAVMEKAIYPGQIERQIQELPVPKWRPTTYQQAMEGLKGFLREVRLTSGVGHFIAWLDGLKHSALQFIEPILRFFSHILREIYIHCKQHWLAFWDKVCLFLDSLYDDVVSTRIKTVWGPTGLFKSSYISTKALFDSRVAHSEFVGRTTFLEDYGKMVSELKTIAAAHPVAKDHVDAIGGPQRRKIKLGAPVMSQNEADLLKLQEGQYTLKPGYDEMVNEYLANGVPQGADGVIYAQYNQHLIDKSVERYEPCPTKVLTTEQSLLATQAAEVLYNRYPDQFHDADTVPMRSVLNYMVKKYSSGVPFMGPKGVKTRQELVNTGLMDVIMKLATKYIEEGVMPVEFFHAFEKSQVVDAGKIVNEGKNVRTVISNEIIHTMIEQCFQLERNKRITWHQTSMGSGMPLNQSMAPIWERMADKKKLFGGTYLIKDATEFDSRCAPILYELTAQLDRLSFKDHPSGNGEAMASVLRAKYDALQSAWIISITKHPNDFLTIGVPDEISYEFVRNLNLPNALFIEDMPQGVTPQKGDFVIVRDKSRMPQGGNWNGYFHFGDPEKARLNSTDHQHFIYARNNRRAFASDVRQLAASDFNLTSNVHAKNRGGATGFTSTTFSNSWADRGGVIIAWYLTMKDAGKEFEMSDFFKYNDYSNTSDDAVWCSYGEGKIAKIKDIYNFKRHCADLGITLKLETTRALSEAEYLSKFVTAPLPEDAEDIQAYRKAKLKAFSASGRVDPHHPHVFTQPRFIVKQNIHAITLRRTALRYYQASAKDDMYVVSMLKRAAGHAQTAAFVRPLFNDLMHEWIDHANHLLTSFKIQQAYRVTTDEYGLPRVEQYNPRWKEQKLSPRQQAILRMIKDGMFPSYMKVLDVHLTVKAPDPAAREKLFRKLNKGVFALDEPLRVITDWAYWVTNSIPDEWSKKFMPGVDMLYGDNPFYSSNEAAARLALWSLLQEFKEEEIDYPMFASRIAEGPYGAIAHPIQTWENWSQPEWHDKFLSTPAVKIKADALRLTVLYLSLTPLEFIIRKFPILGSLYLLLTWSYIGLAKIYGLANTTYWHSRGKSSTVISQVMPRDPYLWMKRLICVIDDWIPGVFTYLLYPLVGIVDAFATPIEQSTKLYIQGSKIKQVAVTNDTPNNPWIPFTEQAVLDLKASRQQRMYVSAPTGTGKSTFFVAAMLSQRRETKVHKIWLVFPRKILRDEWSIPFSFKHQKLMKGVIKDSGSDVYLCTYGHFLTRLEQVDMHNDLVLFDEFHERQGTMILAEQRYRGPVFLMSATPVTLTGLEDVATFAPPLKQRHNTVVHKVPSSGKKAPTVLDMWQLAANAYPDKMDRALVICPTVAEVRRTVAGLQWLGVTAFEVSSHSPKIPENGVIVATQIVDAGMDIKPPASILIDSGKCVSIDRGEFIHPLPWTDPERNKQRIGRVGRLKEGVVYQPASAGTGPRALNYPEGQLFQHKRVADFFQVPQLLPVVPEDGWFIPPKAPLIALNTESLNTPTKIKSVLALHVLHLGGVKEDDIRRYYSYLQRGKSLGEDLFWIDDVLDLFGWRNHSYTSYENALTLACLPDVTRYNIADGSHPLGTPMIPRRGRWIEPKGPAEKLVGQKEMDELDFKDPTIGEKYKRLKNKVSKATRIAQNLDKALHSGDLGQDAHHITLTAQRTLTNILTT